jgi:hypothetical protein
MNPANEEPHTLLYQVTVFLDVCGDPTFMFSSSPSITLLTPVGQANVHSFYMGLQVHMHNSRNAVCMSGTVSSSSKVGMSFPANKPSWHLRVA